ncbi:hypothetical protein OsI_29653 [Oryza sativa Indica Group]|uniref:Uncharacterized protein n=1 Tax=Oryza sativa subsp. indica TaxID=39946 RepID=A2YWE1_ORYSI|nr:hypothetical protein OsI_29653 [Oryza sativa Indica Group]
MAAQTRSGARDHAAGRNGRRRLSHPPRPPPRALSSTLRGTVDEAAPGASSRRSSGRRWPPHVAARCAASGAALRKHGQQCRHKLEQLRKRYRIEGARPVTSLWPYFRRMERFERGPLPVSSAFPPPPPAASPPAAASDDDDDDEEDDEEEEEVEEPIPRNNTRSINGILRDSGGGGGGFSGFAPRPPPQQPPPSFAMLSTAPPRKRVPYEAFQAKVAMADKVKEEEPPPVATRPGGGTNEQLSAVLRDFGQGIMRLERRRMEMQWEIDRGWKETEARHNRMLLDAQRHLHEALAATPPPLKKARREHGGDGS